MSQADAPPELIELVTAAREAAAKAYNPYSQFSVGAAIRTSSGRIFAGCNIENASYSVTLCAERVAGSQAILQREFRWESMVVLSPQRVSLCGVCRQFCHEFAPQMRVWTGFLLDDPLLVGPFLLSDLLPDGMTLDHRNSPS
ncbi:cytidine deaminase [Pirellulaceae bacterium SH467]|jgi:cytidine deaminase